MKLSKIALLLLFSLSLFAQEVLYQFSEIDTVLEDELNLSTLSAFAPTIDENLILLPIEQESNDSSSLFTSFEDALKIAKEEHKIILLELVSINCIFCERMEREVLSLDNVQEVIKKDFVLAQVDVDSENLPLGLSKQMTPMFVFVTEDEDITDMRLGYIEELDFLNLLGEKSKK